MIGPGAVEVSVPAIVHAPSGHTLTTFTWEV
eukprot:COSAG03_NODE_13523_length_500_cov_0.451372_2_plen_30_part_01